MRFCSAAFVVLLAIGWPEPGKAELIQWRLGGTEGADWQEETFLSVMMDAASTAGTIQPLELDPQINMVTQLKWSRYRQPIDLDYVVGKPRAWNGIGVNQNLFFPLAELIDGDLETHWSKKDWLPSGSRSRTWWSYFITLDLGAPIPADRFVLVPAAGVSPFTQEPYRPNFAFPQYELTGSNDVAMVNRQEIQDDWFYQPLDFLLERVGQNYEAVIDIDFPLQYLQFFRMHLNKEFGFGYPYFSIAELEVYGRGFVPGARWVSQVIDLGQVVNIGPVHWGLSKWRKEEGGELVPALEAPVRIRVEVKTGLDDTPIAYQSYNDLQQHVEVTREEYERLKPRSRTVDPPSVGWRGPIIDDQNQWSFWSSPLHQSGQRPRVHRGRYLQLQIQLETDELWEYARLDSLRIEASPILAHRVLGEVAVAVNLQPERRLAAVQPGEQTKFVYDIGAEFSGSGQNGFDAIRFLTPSAGTFVALQMGEPLAVATPDSVVQEESGFVLFLPQPVSRATPGHLRVQLATTVFGVSGQLNAEVFERNSDSLPQRVEAGNVSAEIGTDQILVVAQEASLSSVLGALTMQPSAFTPQGDGINDQLHINYTLFRVLEKAEVTAAIYTLSGRQVRQIRIGAMDAGHHSTTWDGRDEVGQTVAPGLYLVQMKVETNKGLATRIRPIAVVY